MNRADRITRGVVAGLSRLLSRVFAVLRNHPETIARAASRATNGGVLCAF